MFDQTCEIIVMAIFLITVVAFWLVFGYIPLDYWRNICGQKSSEYRIDENQAINYVTEEAKEFNETTKSHEEGQTPIILSLLNDPYSV